MRVYKDPTVLKAMVLKAGPSKGAAVPRVVNTDDNLVCRFCKESGHILSNCPKIAAQTCSICQGKGHGARFCPQQAGGPSTMPKKEEKKASAKRAKAKKSKKRTDSSDEDSSRVTYSYMARAKRGAPVEEEEGESSKKPEKTQKTAKKNKAKRTLDPEVVELFRRLPVPLELIAKHGASFESQAKRAVKEVYDGGHSHRKKINPARMAALLSHAMIVSGVLANKVKCNHLIIDSGSSITSLDINTTR